MLECVYLRVCENIIVAHSVSMVRSEMCDTFKCLCNLYVVLLVVGIQCLEYCVVVAQSVWATVGA